jgi:hypothetical protein
MALLAEDPHVAAKILATRSKGALKNYRQLICVQILETSKQVRRETSKRARRGAGID